MPLFSVSRRFFVTALVLLLGFVLPLSLLIYYEPFDLRYIQTRLPASHSSPYTYSSLPYIPPAEGPILLVSAFFPLAKSKHSPDDYKHWISLFLGSITTDIYFFTPPEWESTIRNVRGDLPIVINTSFATPFDIPPLQHRRDAYNRMHALDREASRHSPDLYATWTAKSYFLREAVDNMLPHIQSPHHAESILMTRKEYQFAFWSDAGAFRQEHFWKDWPDLARIGEVWMEAVIKTGAKPEDLIFFPIESLPHRNLKWWDESMGPVDNSISEGSFFGGMPEAIRWWYKLYFTYHDYWLERGHFVGKDQTLFNALFMLYPSRFFGVYLQDRISPAAVALRSSAPFGASLLTPLGHCVNSWFYYIFFLGREPERAKIANLWLGSDRHKLRCRLTRIVTLEELLHRAFGSEWNPPNATLMIDDGLSVTDHI